MNQSIQPLNQSNQPINQSIQPMNQSNQAMNRSNQAINQSNLVPQNTAPPITRLSNADQICTQNMSLRYVRNADSTLLYLSTQVPTHQARCP